MSDNNSFEWNGMTFKNKQAYRPDRWESVYGDYLVRKSYKCLYVAKYVSGRCRFESLPCSSKEEALDSIQPYVEIWQNALSDLPMGKKPA